jgi:hypothetical protein
MHDNHFYVESSASILRQVILADKLGNEVDSDSQPDCDREVQRNNEEVADINKPIYISEQITLLVRFKPALPSWIIRANLNFTKLCKEPGEQHHGRYKQRPH